jgi:hypothetical protein
VIVGPSVILLATSIGSGEFVLWPFITSQVGLVAMWMEIVGVFTQYFINMEIERYTLAAGESAVTGFTRLWRPWGVIMALAALAFAGAGGTVNLVQSNWIRDMGLGMGAYSPKIVSPLTGEEQAASSTGFFFRQTDENLRRWRGWWKVANQEQCWLFAVIGAASIILLSLLTYSTVFGREGLTSGFGFVKTEGEVLKETVAPWLGTAFWLTGVVVLLSTNLGVLDHMGRLTADVLKVDLLRDSELWTESRIYFAVIWAEIVFGSIVLLVVGITAPLVLLVISSATNGVVMFVHSVLLIQLNRFSLPSTIRLRSYRLAAMVWSVRFFGFFCAILVWDEGGSATVPRRIRWCRWRYSG